MENEESNSISVNANSSANAGNNNTDENGVVSGKNTSGNQMGGNWEKQDKTKQANTPETSATNQDAPFGDTELNKGLESQARDEESV